MRKREGTKFSALIISCLLSAYLHAANGYPAILWAAVADDIEVAAHYLENGGDVNVADDYGHTALILASEKGNLNMVIFLLEWGADPRIETPSGVTALKIARDSEVKRLIEEALDNNHFNQTRGLPPV